MSDPLLLQDLHERLGARFGEADGVLAPLHYGDPAGEHEAVRERAGVIDRSERGKIEVTGKDRATFIHGLISNDVKGLAPGQGNESALLDVHGKVIALLAVHCLSDRLILETDSYLRESLLATIDRYLFSERAELEDVTAASGILTVAGPSARKTVEQALPVVLPDLAPRHHVVATVEGTDVRIVRTDETGEEGYDLWVGTADLERLWERLREAGARPVGREAWNVLRVEAGAIRYGVDVDASTLLLEAALPGSYSLNKGCYMGQEVVARITYRGHVNRKIVGFRFDDSRVPASGAPVTVEGKEVGRITSAVLSPALGVALALGFLRREHQEPGTRVEVGGGASGVIPPGRGGGASVLPADAAPRDLAHSPRARRGSHAEPPGGRDEPLPPPAPVQPRRLVSLGSGGVRAGAARGQAHLPVGRLLGLPLVPRDGARVVRGRRDRRPDERAFVSIKVDREERPGRRLDLHAGRPGDDGPRRLADVRVHDARRRALLRRHVLSARRPPRDAGIPAGARRGRRVLPRPARRRRPGRAASSSSGSARASTSGPAAIS